MKRVLEKTDWNLVGMWVLMGFLLKMFKGQASIIQLATPFGFVLVISLQAVLYWFVLRKYIHYMSLWILASVAGMLVVWLIPVFLRDLDNQPFHEMNTVLDIFFFSLLNAIMIFIKSAFQWVVLRKEVRYAYCWILGSVGAILIKEVLTILILVPWIPNLSMRYLFYFPFGDYLIEIIFLIITGMVIAYLLPSFESTNNQRLELETL